MLAKAKLVVPVPIPWGQQQQYRGVWDAPHLAFSTTVQRRFTGGGQRAPRQYTSSHYHQGLHCTAVDEWGTTFLHLLISSCLAQCGSKKYPHHHTGVQRSRVATFVFHTPARNSLEERGCKVTAAWLRLRGGRAQHTAASAPADALSSLGSTLTVHSSSDKILELCDETCI